MKSPISFNNDLPLKDKKDRTYTSYGEVYWYVDNSFNYKELAPNIPMTGTFVYNVPIDSDDYYLEVSKSGTNQAFNLLVK